MTFVSVVHVFVAVILIVLVLIQDSKSGAVSGTFGGGGNANSLLGATGATTLANKATRLFVILFAITCIILTRLSSQHGGSALDTAGTVPAESKAPVTTSTDTTTSAPAANSSGGGESSPATPAPAP